MWCMLGRGTKALWLAAEWACRLDICRSGLRTVMGKLCNFMNDYNEVCSSKIDVSPGQLLGYIQSKSIMKLVLALKANAMPRRSLTKPTRVL